MLYLAVFQNRGERAVSMGKVMSGECEKDSACGPGKGRLPERKTVEEEAYFAGRNIGYHLGYNHGFESGFDKGYAEGSTFGYNNGFLAALRLGENGNPSSKAKDFVSLQHLIAEGMVKIFLAGYAAGEAEKLFKNLELEATVLNRK